MDTIFTLNENDSEKPRINLDDLYERKKNHDLNTLAIYNKILGRIHKKVKNISKQQVDVQYCWFIVPEMMIGIPQYDNNACIAYCIHQLNDNGFLVRYTHPNLLLISWKHWVPSYVRNEIRKKTGMVVDGYGKRIEKQPKENNKVISHNKSNKQEYKDVKSYKPSGHIYNQEYFKRIEDISK